MLRTIGVQRQGFFISCVVRPIRLTVESQFIMSKKLLIVDDSFTSRQIIRSNIKKFRRDWQIFESENGDDALNMLRIVNPDFVTMDVNMPNISGVECADRMLAEVPSLRICLVTANRQDSLRLRTLEAGMGFVEKPVNEESITRVLRFFEPGSIHA